MKGSECFAWARSMPKLPDHRPSQRRQTVRPMLVGNLYEVGALPSLQAEAPSEHVPFCERQRVSVAELERVRLGRLDAARRVLDTAKSFAKAAVLVGAAYLTFFFVAYLG